MRVELHIGAILQRKHAFKETRSRDEATGNKVGSMQESTRLSKMSDRNMLHVPSEPDNPTKLGRNFPETYIPH